MGFPVRDASSAKRAAEEILLRGAECCIVKMGVLGAYCARQGAGRHIAPFVVEAVDTVGAGDAFNGALAVALAEGRELEEALGWAMAAGALAVTRSGALDSMPRRDEVEALLCSQKSR